MPRHLVFVQAGLGAGGAEKVVSLLAHHLVEVGDRVTVLALSQSPSGSYFQYPTNVRVLCHERDIAKTFAIGRICRRIRWLRDRVRELEPDLVVSFLTKVNVISLLATIGTGLPVVISERNNPTQQAASKVWHFAGRSLLGRARQIVMQTEAARRTLPPELRAISRVIPNPSSIPERFRTNVERPHGVVAVGRLTPQKGFDLLLRAFAMATRNESTARLAIWGEGPERARLEEMIVQLGLTGRAVLRGRSAQPYGWLDSGNIFVLSSRFEGFPNVLIEAMAGGLAPVAFDCAWGPSDMICDGETGLLVPDGDVEALASALSRVLGDVALQQRLGVAARIAAADFSEETVFSAWDTAFDAALACRA